MPNIRNRFEDPDVFDLRGILKDGAVALVRMECGMLPMMVHSTQANWHIACRCSMPNGDAKAL